MKKKITYYVVGLMSGTSVDGLDAVLCRFDKISRDWKYEILKSSTYQYPDELSKRLYNCRNLSSYEIDMLDKDLGKFSAEAVNSLLKSTFSESADIISSHGHTVFHDPDNNYTLQIGSGKEIANNTGITTINNFREQDVKMGGQGAPLVPIGDELLFPEYDQCLNLGGFSNTSENVKGIRLAGDICAVNTVLNRYALYYKLNYDNRGEIGRRGEIIYPLLEYFDSLEFYGEKFPRSLGIEWLDKNIFPEADKYLSSFEVKDILRTWYEHSSELIAKKLKGKVLLSGGGVYNDFLIEKIKSKSDAEIVIDNKLTDTKEALIFAFLGVLRFINENNILASVTGAYRDHSSGDIYA